MTHSETGPILNAGENYFVAQSAPKASIRFKSDGSIRLSAGLADKAFVATENYKNGQFNISSILERLYPRRDLKPFRRVILRYTDSQGKEQVDVLSLEGEGKSVSFKNGKLRLDSRLLTGREYASSGYGVISGDSNFYRSKDFEGSKNKTEEFTNLRLYFDTFTKRQLKAFVDKEQAKFNNETSGKIIAAGGRANALQPGVVLFDESYEFDDSDASIGVELSVAPGIAAAVDPPNVPDCWYYYRYLDPEDWGLSLSAGFTWEVDADLDPGTEDGEVVLASQSYDGPSIPIPVAGIVNGELTSGLDLSAGVTIGALNRENYEFTASQHLGFDAGLSSNGFAITNTSDPSIKVKFPDVDKLTGLGLEANATPYVGLDFGLIADVPVFGTVDFASAGLQVGLPVVLDLKTSPTPASLTLGVSANLGGNVTLLPFVDGGFSLDTPTVDLFSLSTGNLLA